MSQSTQWSLRNDCLNPLAEKLSALAAGFRRPFDVAQRDQLDREYRQILEASGWSDSQLTDAQRGRLEELRSLIPAQIEPPCTLDVYSIYRDCRIDLAVNWLKLNVSVEFANDFHRTLTSVQKRFADLDFKACQIINGDTGKDSTTHIRYAIQRLIDRHYELLRAEYSNSESYPDRDELPDDLRAFEVEILDEYTLVEQQFRETSAYLRQVSAMLLSRAVAEHESPPRPPEPQKMSLDARATAALIQNPDWSNEKIAEEIQCNVKSLTKSRTPNFMAAREQLRAAKAEALKGSKYKGELEAEWDE